MKAKKVHVVTTGISRAVISRETHQHTNISLPMFTGSKQQRRCCLEKTKYQGKKTILPLNPMALFYGGRQRENSQCRCDFESWASSFISKMTFVPLADLKSNVLGLKIGANVGKAKSFARKQS